MFIKPLLPTAPVSGTAVPTVADPASSASLHPSPSESKSKRFGIPSPSASTSVEHVIGAFPFFTPAEIIFKSVKVLEVVPAHDKTKL